MQKQKSEYFTSRGAFIISMLAVAVGAGNIWRFARVVAQNGGGSFIILWVIFLFVWSIPLIIAEIALGKISRKAPIGAFAIAGGKSYGWLGAFVALVATAILFYYSVVVGWGFSYSYFAISGQLGLSSDYTAFWDSYAHSYKPLIAHFCAIAVACGIIYKGVVKGIERSNNILIPLLIFMILLIGLRAVTLPNSWEGIRYLFTPHLADLLNFEVWIAALTQNAWDTGAGWGLLLVYAGYARKKESIIVNGSLAAFGNNAISLFMGVTIFAAVFSLEHQAGIDALISGEGATATGLTFIYLPQLFTQMPGGPFVHAALASLFFIAFSFATLSSLTSMVQLAVQTITELGMRRNAAILITGLAALLCGAPSALSLAFFDNQDWVWAIGLIMSGLFFAIVIIRFGVDRFRTEVINTSPDDFKLGKFYNYFIGVLIPVQAVLLLGWYFTQSILHLDREEWWNPFRIYSVGTIILQWGLALLVFFLLNRWLVRRTLQHR